MDFAAVVFVVVVLVTTSFLVGSQYIAQIHTLDLSCLCHKLCIKEGIRLHDTHSPVIKPLDQAFWGRGFFLDRV